MNSYQFSLTLLFFAGIIPLGYPRRFLVTS